MSKNSDSMEDAASTYTEGMARVPHKPKPRKRRDYAGELSELRSAVITAVRLLRKVQPSNELVNVAIELLEP